ncbi:MAG TPA: NAD(P)/FAD-dependent oxidoreductase [Longimicrobiaceae bacterium]|nr:NAD(P)/FAD-dependent oxidoreductase [Longimicrobiaceae bacterium]
MAHSSGTSVAVVGAGPAGMATAFRLAQAGAAVTVYEATARVGGRARTDLVDGWRVDPACQLFGSVYTTFLRVLRAAGGGSLCVRTPGRDALWRRGKAHEVVYGSPASMLASGALPFGLKLRLAVYPPYLHRHAAALEPAALERAAAEGLDRESIAAWGVREPGRDFVDLLAAPTLAALYGTLPEEASAGFYHAVARQGMHAEVLALAGGASAFCDALAAALSRLGGRVLTGRRVRAVHPAKGGVELSGEGWTERFGAVVLAVPAPAAREIDGMTRPVVEWLEGVRVRPTVSLALLLDRPAGVRWFALSFARGESRALAAACVQENKLGDRVPPGRGLVVAYPLPEAGERLAAANADADTVLRALLPDLSRALPGIESAIRRVVLYHWPHAWTVFSPGYLARLGELRRTGLDFDGRIALAGDYLYMPNLEGAALSGVRAAERVCAALGLPTLPGD